jgi:CRISPR-associated protein Csx10
MPLLKYTLDLEQPLLAAGRVSDPNSNASLDFIPGSLLRGLLIHRYCAQAGQSEITHDPLARALFFDGVVRYLHAHPADPDGARTLPTPRTLLKAKHTAPDSNGQWTLYNSAHAAFSAPPEQQLEREEQPFITLGDDGNSATLYAPRRMLSVHMQRDRRMGRATAENGAIFQYQALAEGQRFIGLIVVDDEPAAANWLTKLKDLAADPVGWLGGSRSAGYGRVRLSLADTAAPEVPRVDEDDEDDEDEVTLTLLSDTVLIDSEGHPLNWADPNRLPAALGAALSEATDTSVTLSASEIAWARSSVGRVLLGGYNSTWRLPLPPAPALAAGSVLVLRKRLPAPVRSAILARGIGLRRVEGYGRCAINLPLAAQLSVTAADVATPTRAPQPIVGEAEQLARRMAQRRLDQAIEDGITRFLRTRKPHPSPRRSQLAWLAVQAQQVLNTDEGQMDQAAQAFRERLQNLRQAAKQQFERAQINGRSLAQWLDEHLAQPAQIWATLGLAGDQRLGVAGVEPDKSSVERRATLQLIAAAAGDWRKEVSDDERG